MIAIHSILLLVTSILTLIARTLITSIPIPITRIVTTLALIFNLHPLLQLLFQLMFLSDMIHLSLMHLHSLFTFVKRDPLVIRSSPTNIPKGSRCRGTRFPVAWCRVWRRHLLLYQAGPRRTNTPPLLRPRLQRRAASAGIA
ncbi:hypothetical protein V2G26_015778 [Clonostachys chloroleuca]